MAGGIPMDYCMACGTRLEERYLEKEGRIVPYCPHCEDYRFPVFSTAVHIILENPAHDKILLIRQYGRPSWILVAGYVNKGENAESAIRRELSEELRLSATGVRYLRSEYFEKNNVLMLNFTCTASTEDLSGMTPEVDEARWFSRGEAARTIKEGSLAAKFLHLFLAEEDGTKI